MYGTRRLRWIRLAIMALAFSAAARAALAQLPGPFEFQFVAPVLTNIVLFPLRLAGCLS